MSFSILDKRVNQKMIILDVLETLWFFLTMTNTRPKLMLFGPGKHKPISIKYTQYSHYFIVRVEGGGMLNSPKGGVTVPSIPEHRERQLRHNN